MPWIGIREAGQYTSKCPDYVRAAIMRGEITAYRPRDQEKPRIVIAQDDLDDWIRRDWELVQGNTL